MQEKKQTLVGVLVTTIIAALIATTLYFSAQSNANKKLAQRNEEIANTAQAASVLAVERANMALSRQLVGQAQYLYVTDPYSTLAPLLMVESLRRAPSLEASQVLQTRLNYLPAKLVSSMTHLGGVSALAFSPDGKWVASGGCEKVSDRGRCVESVAQVWETETGKKIAHMTHDDWVTFVAFTPDGKWVLSGGRDGTSRVWEAETGKEIARTTHDGWVASVAFSPDGKWVVSGSADNTARVWETKTGKEIARMTHDDWVAFVAFSPDGKRVVSGGGDGTVRVWEVDTGKEITRVTFERINTIALSPNGKLGVSGVCINWGSEGCFESAAIVWETETGKEIARVTQDYEVTSVAFSPNGKWVASGGIGGVLVWNAETGTEIAHMTQENYIITSISFSADGKWIASGGLYTATRIWEAETGREIVRLMDSGGSGVAFSPDGKWALSEGCVKWNNNESCAEYAARVWKIEAAHMTHDKEVGAVAISPDEKWSVSGSKDGTVRVWETESGREIARMTHGYNVAAVAFSPDGRWVVSGGWDGTARVWEAETGKEIARMTHGYDVAAVAFSPDGKWVVSGGGDGTARVWEAETGREIARVTEYYESMVAFSPNGEWVASGAGNGGVWVWETKTGKGVSYMTSGDHFRFFDFSPDGKRIVAGGCNTWDWDIRVCVKGMAIVWEIKTGKEIARMAHVNDVTSVAFSANGKWVVSGGCGEVDAYHNCIKGLASVWEAETGKEIARMTHDKDVTSVAFSPDGKWVASGSIDNTARVWEAETGKEIARMTHDGGVLAVTFSPDGKWVVSGGYDGTARAWLWQMEDVIRRACERLPRNLTREEWLQYLGDEPYRATCQNLPEEQIPTPTPTITPMDMESPEPRARATVTP